MVGIADPITVCIDIIGIRRLIGQEIGVMGCQGAATDIKISQHDLLHAHILGDLVQILHALNGKAITDGQHL